MKMRMNPIVKKDLKISVRSMRLSWGLFAYEAVLALAFMLALAVIQAESSSYYGYGNIYSYLVYLFPVLAVAQVCIVALIVPIITASSISGEKERQTLDIMLTTCMSPFSIVFGKVISAVLQILFFVAASTPIMSLAFVVGGMSWMNLFYFLLTIILLSVFSGSIGIFCSSVCRKSISAVILSFVFYLAFYGLTFIPLILRLILGKSNAGESMVFLLFNPIVFFVEFFVEIMTGGSMFGGSSFTKNNVGILTYWLTRGKVWMFASAGCILLMSFVFMAAAAWRVNPLHGSSGRKTGRIKEG
jgi:ABC-type transport system involved in multi-copper enzyme maturation permease subunit